MDPPTHPRGGLCGSPQLLIQHDRLSNSPAISEPLTRPISGPSSSQDHELTVSQRFLLQRQDSRSESFGGTGEPCGSPALNPNPDEIKFVQFDDEDIPRCDKDTGNTLIERYRFHGRETWLIDIKYYTLAKPKEYVPMSLAVWNLYGEQLVYCPIQYYLSREDLWDQIEPFANTKNATEDAKKKRKAAFFVMFSKHYGADNTHTQGLTFSEIRDKLLDKGWTPRHVLISYREPHDISIANKIMSGEASIITDTNPARNTVDVFGLVQSMNPNLPSYKLERVHESYFPRVRGKKTYFHQAAWDVAALRQVILALICSTPLSF